MNVYIPPIIEKVYNVQGSTAAPGSGEYHRYRAMRRRERTIAAAMENEYKERKDQKDFEDKKEMKNKRIEIEREKKKKRRFIREEKKKMKKEILKVKSPFDKNIPIIEQIKNEMGEDQFKKISYQEENNNYEDDYLDNQTSKISSKQFKRIVRNEMKLNDDLEKFDKNEEEKLKLLKLFPQVEKKDYEFDNYDEYEEHLEIMDIIKKNENFLNNPDEDENKEEINNVKYVEEEQNIIIHDEF